MVDDTKRDNADDLELDDQNKENNTPIAGAEPLNEWPEAEKPEPGEPAELKNSVSAKNPERSVKANIVKPKIKATEKNTDRPPTKKRPAIDAKQEHKKHKTHQPKKTEHKRNHKAKNKTAIILGIVIVIIAIAAGIYTRYSSQNKDVVAVVNGEKITLTQFQTNYGKINDAALQRYGFLPPFITPELVLNDTISFRALVQEAKKQGVYIDAASAEGHLREELATQKLDANAWAAEQGRPFSELVDEYRDQYSVFMLLNSTLTSQIRVSEQDMASFYEQNLDQFAVPAQVRAYHLLVCFEGSLKCLQNRTEDEAKAIMAGLLARAKSGEDLRDLAYNYSDDPSAIFNQGDLGWFGRGQMVAEFEDASFSLNVGDVTFVKTDYGYHVIKLAGKQDERNLTFDEAKPSINKAVFAAKQQTAMLSYVVQLVKNSKIKIYPQVLAKLKVTSFPETSSAVSDELAIKDIAVE